MNAFMEYTIGICRSCAETGFLAVAAAGRLRWQGRQTIELAI